MTLQLIAAGLVWVFTQAMALINQHYTPEQRDKALKAIAAAASAVAGAAVALVAVLDSLQGGGKVDIVSVKPLIGAVVTMAQVFGISQLYHHARKAVTNWLFKRK